MLRSTSLIGSVVLGGSVFLAAALAHSDTPGQLTIDWRAPDGCPTAAEVRAQVDRLLGGPARLAPGESLEARASVTHDDVWRVSLATVSRANVRKRTIEAESCRGLAEATALILALMIDPNAAASHDGPASATSASAVPSASAPPTPDPTAAPPASAIATAPASEAPVPAAGSAMPVRLAVGPLVSADVGLLPAPEVAMGGYAAVLWGRFKVALAGRYGLGEPTAHVEGAPASDQGSLPGGKFRLVSGSLTLCHALARGWFDFGICGSFDAGRIRAEGINVNRIDVRDGLWLALSAGGLASWNVSPRLAIPLELGLVIPLSRYRFVLDNVGEVFPPTGVGGRATMGVELRF